MLSFHNSFCGSFRRITTVKGRSKKKWSNNSKESKNAQGKIAQAKIAQQVEADLNEGLRKYGEEGLFQI